MRNGFQVKKSYCISLCRQGRRLLHTTVSGLARGGWAPRAISALTSGQHAQVGPQLLLNPPERWSAQPAHLAKATSGHTNLYLSLLGDAHSRQRVRLELPAPGFFGQGPAALSHPSPLGSSPNTGQARLEWSASTDSCVCQAALCDTASPWHNVKPTNKKAWSAPLFAMRSANVLRSYALCFGGILRENSRKH